MTTKKLVLASSLFFALGAAGCDKSPDLGHIQDSTLELVKLHQQEIDTLQRRADGDMQRGRAFGADAAGIADAGRMLSEARAGIDQLRAQANSASAQLANAAKSGEVEEVDRQSDEILEKLENGEVAVKKNLASVENWLMSVENRPAAQASMAPGAPASTAPKTDEAPATGAAPETPVPATGAEAGSGASAGSGAGSAAK